VEAIFVRTILSGIKTIASVKKIMEFRINLLAYGDEANLKVNDLTMDCRANFSID
jgi:hypothetical protein